ncbi:MAG: glycosyltransferase family 2 protein [Candidatus Woesearchaeota archaeon]
MPKKKIITIIPAHNEEKTIAQVVREVKQYSDEVLVIDDGSVDNTAINAAEEGAVVISNNSQIGLCRTMRRGYIEAIRRNADVVVQIDADGQYDASDIPKLLRPVLECRADMVIASRLGEGMNNLPLLKRLGNKLCTFITNIVAGTRLSDTQTGFRAIRSELVKNILPEGKKTYTQEMIVRASREGWRIAEIPSHFKMRKYGSSRLIRSTTVYAFFFILNMFSLICEYYLFYRKK